MAIGIFGFIVFMLVPAWKIVTKAGYNGAWAIVGVVPLLNIVMLWVFAFSKWPIDKEPG